MAQDNGGPVGRTRFGDVPRETIDLDDPGPHQDAGTVTMSSWLQYAFIEGDLRVVVERHDVDDLHPEVLLAKVRGEAEQEGGVVRGDLEGEQFPVRERLDDAVELAQRLLGGARFGADRILDGRARRIEGEDVVGRALRDRADVGFDGRADRVVGRCHECLLE